MQGTITVLPAGSRNFWWLPGWLTSTNLTLARARTTARRETMGKFGLVFEERLDDERFHEHGNEPIGLGAHAVRDVVDAIDRSGDLNRSVRRLKPALVPRVVLRETHKSREVSPCRSARHGHECRVASVLACVFADPNETGLDVGELIRQRDARTQPVVDRETQPPGASHVVQQGESLLTLVAHDPAATMDVHED